MERGILFFDIDGTILTDDGKRQIPESTRRALAAAKEKGHLVFVNTGRVFLNVEPMIRNLGFDGFVCGCGTNIYYHGEELLRHRIPAEQCRETVRVIQRCGIQALYEAADMNGFDHQGATDNPMMGDLIRYFTEDGRVVVDVNAPEFHFDKLTGWIPTGQDISEFLSYIQGRYEFIDRGSNDDYQMCEIVPAGFSKASGMKFLLDYFGIPHERSYAFGDSTNDLPMLNYAAHSVAMGGSAQVVCDAVEFVTRSIYEDGLEYAMQYFGLI